MAQENMKNEFKKTEKKMESHAQEAQDALVEAAKNIKHEAKALFNESVNVVKEKSSDYGHVVCNYVKEQPMTALGIAAAIGAGIVLLLRK